MISWKDQTIGPYTYSFCNGRLDLDLEQKANWIIVLDFVW